MLQQRLHESVRLVVLKVEGAGKEVESGGVSQRVVREGMSQADLGHEREVEPGARPGADREQRGGDKALGRRVGRDGGQHCGPDVEAAEAAEAAEVDAAGVPELSAVRTAEIAGVPRGGQDQATRDAAGLTAGRARGAGPANRWRRE